MNRIKVHDKWFKLYLTNKQIESAIEKVAQEINNDMANGEKPMILSVLTGSFMFMSSLVQKLSFTCDINFIKVSSYNGTQSTGNIKQVMGLIKPVKDRKVIIVEDIVDTGNTIEELEKILANEGAKEVKVCTMMFKPASYSKDIPIDYHAMSIPNDFIVGYGLDYDEEGRQYKDIYVLDPDQQEK